MSNAAPVVEPTVPHRVWPHADSALVSFDGGVEHFVAVQRPDRYRFFNQDRAIDGEARISRGAGLSYVAASFGHGITSVEHGSFNRILGFDSASRTVKVEAGITLGALYDFLISRGLYLPVQPGHGAITVGGCIAADVHGKNHARDGTFSKQVASISLFHPDHGLLELSRGKNAMLFDLTCGGFGLTGYIVSAEITAAPLPGHSVRLRTVKCLDVSSGMAALAESAGHADFAYSWHDFTRRGLRFGRGFVVAATFVKGPVDLGQHAPLNVPRLSARSRGRLPVALLNRWTVAPFNRAYELRMTMEGGESEVPLASALFPAHKAQVYFQLFGRKGFHEYQVLVPWDSSEAYLQAVASYTRTNTVAITLASAKCFAGSRSLLKFNGSGLCIALNVPRNATSHEFLEFLDGLLPGMGAIPNLIKDSRLPRSVVDMCYPEADRFRSRLADFDPRRRFKSELSHRLEL